MITMDVTMDNALLKVNELLSEEDIIRMIDLQKVHFVALNLERFPRFGPEETNDQQVQLSSKVDAVTVEL